MKSAFETKMQRQHELSEVKHTLKEFIMCLIVTRSPLDKEMENIVF